MSIPHLRPSLAGRLQCCASRLPHLRHPWAYAAGWVVQGLILLSGFVVTAMFIVGGLFVALWWIGLLVGRRGERIHAERWGTGDDPQSAQPDGAG